MRSAPLILSRPALVSPLGVTLGETWKSLLAGSYITDHGRVPLEFDQGHDRCTELALCAARQSCAEGCPPRSALVVGTSKGAIESWLPSTTAPGPALLGLGSVATAVAAEIGLHGPCLTISAACASGLHALIRAAMMLRSGQASRVLVVASESSLHPLFVGSFRRLGVLAPPGQGCRPMDQRRAGFLVSEAAASVWVSHAGDAVAGGGDPTIALDDWAMAGDAYHITASDPDGLALRTLLRRVVNGTEPLDLVHTHATGTQANDALELAALETALAAQPSPLAYSHKAALGHSLGASGLVSVVLNLMCHQHGRVPGNILSDQPLPTRLRISQSPVTQPIRRSLALAAGFGGPMAAVTLRTL